MSSTDSRAGKYLLAALLGAAVGGLAFGLATRAIPIMMSRAMPRMMRHMMAQVAPGAKRIEI